MKEPVGIFGDQHTTQILSLHPAYSTDHSAFLLPSNPSIGASELLEISRRRLIWALKKLDVLSGTTASTPQQLRAFWPELKNVASVEEQKAAAAISNTSCPEQQQQLLLLITVSCRNKHWVLKYPSSPLPVVHCMRQ